MKTRGPALVTNDHYLENEMPAAETPAHMKVGYVAAA
jgi:hypothetical protein